MTEFVISTYLKEIQYGMQDTQENTARSIFASITDCLESPPDLPPRTITGIMQRKLDVPMYIKKATADKNIVAEAYSYFDDYVIDAINPLLLNEVCEKIHRLYNNDTNLARSTVDKLNEEYDNQDYGKFLCSSFLCAVNKDNKLTDSIAEINDIPLLTEVNYKCPCCHNNLIKKTKTTSIKRYEITPIFPNNLDSKMEEEFKSERKPAKNLNSIENLIALCTDCSEEYVNDPNIDDYIKIFDLKTQVADGYKLQVKLDTIGLEEEIFHVIDGLTNTNTVATDVEEFRMDALRITNKIEPSNILLQQIVTQHVLTYYRYIEKLLSDFDLYAKNRFNTIASEIQLVYQTINSMNYSQGDVYELISEWMNNKLKLKDTKRYKIACNIVVSFFIQNCEVFDEIT